MAVYRFEAKIIGRAKGRSATAAAAYRAATRIDDERTGQSFDYSRKGGVLHSEILAPPGTPDWMLDRAQLWNAVEAAEKRRDAQLARDVTLSLPHELTHDQRVELVRDFLRTEFIARGMVADVSIHAPDREGDQRNHHAHVMLTMRELTGAGFGPKVREWNATERLEEWREHWAVTSNRHLEQHGHEARVDHRSLADQGIDREPEPKQGPVATEMEREGRPSHAGDDRRAAQARNQARNELAAEIDGIEAELIYLDPDRPRGAAFDIDREGDDGDGRPRRATRPIVTTSDGGMVAQQNEALRRFRRNSERLEQRRAAETERGVDETSLAPRDRGSDGAPGQKPQGTDAMASKYDGMRDEQAKATPTPEQPQHAPPEQKPDIEIDPGSPSPTRPDATAYQSPGTSWPMEQTMPAQNAAAVNRDKAVNARRQENETDHELDEPAAKSPDLGDQASPEQADPEKEPEQSHRKLRFYRDREEGQEQGAGRDYGSLKREQSEAEPSKSEDGSHKLNFARDRGGGPEHDR